ncbi:MAG: NAD(P)-dependent oxidoreductase [Chloroflexota bacterium]
MKVLITGGTGNVGRAVTARLVTKGWDVHVIGLDESFSYPGATYTICDILNFADLQQQMQGCSAIVHLAAISHPMSMAGQDLFHINVSGTYNVFEAAAAKGIKRVVQASSINAFGCFWGNTDIRPQYLPIDEAHPTFTTDPYSFSKQIVEEIGDYYWRREGISSIAFRLPGVWSQERMTDPAVHTQKNEIRDLLNEFASQSSTEQAKRLADIRTATVTYRQQKSLEFPASQERVPLETFSDDPLFRQYAFDRFNFWTYIDERDSAQAMEIGITADFEGSHTLFINHQHNWLDYDSATLARLFFPEIAEDQVGLTEAQSLVSIQKAKDLIGFWPEHTF